MLKLSQNLQTCACAVFLKEELSFAVLLNGFQSMCCFDDLSIWWLYIFVLCYFFGGPSSWHVDDEKLGSLSQSRRTLDYDVMVTSGLMRNISSVLRFFSTHRIHMDGISTYMDC